MSFDAVIDAIKNDPELAKELQAAGTPAERAAILDAHGIEKPHSQSQFPDMASVSGAGTATDVTSAANAGAAAA